MALKIDIRGETVDLFEDLHRLKLRRTRPVPMSPREIYEEYSQHVPSSAPHGTPFSAARDVRLARAHLRRTHPSLPASEREHAARRAARAYRKAHEVFSLLQKVAQAHARRDLHAVARLLHRAWLVELNRFGCDHATEQLAAQILALKD